VKRSEINQLIRDATDCFESKHWALPPHPRWDVTDFGLGDWRRHGLVLVNLAEHEEYCEKLMYAKRGLVTPAHSHGKKKEDIICRWGELQIRLWAEKPSPGTFDAISVLVNGQPQTFFSGEAVTLTAGERITLEPGTWHEFAPVSEECIIGEVSTANDDQNDNFFASDEVGRYAKIEEDEPCDVALLSD